MGAVWHLAQAAQNAHGAGAPWHRNAPTQQAAAWQHNCNRREGGTAKAETHSKREQLSALYKSEPAAPIHLIQYVNGIGTHTIWLCYRVELVQRP